MKKENWNIIAAYLANEELDEEALELIGQLKANSDEWEKKVALFNAATDAARMRRFDTDKAWEKFQIKPAQTAKKRSMPLYRFMVKYAAAVALLLVASVLFWYFFNTQDSITYATTANDFSHPVYELDDGSRVSLNHGSSIELSRRFGKKTREIKLTGEAYFEVAPDQNCPFIVHTYNAEIEVLGTAFNVNAYSNTKNVEVAVEHGKVQFRSANNDAIYLEKGEKGILTHDYMKLTKMASFDLNELAWATGYIEFNAANLNEVAHTLEKTFNIKMNIDEEVDTMLMLTASFTRQDIDYIFEVAGMTLDLDIEQTNRRVYLLKNKK